MSYVDGWAALNLEMPEKVPRTEYSAESHWELVKKVTGVDVNSKSPDEVKLKASSLFRKEWDYGFVWNTLIGGQALEECRTRMGHAVYAADGVDFDTRIECPFDDPEDAFDFQPMEVYGRREHGKLVEDFNRNYRMRCEQDPDAVNTTGIYITLVSGLLEIFGWDMMLMALGIDAEAFGETANRYAEWMQ